MANTQLFSLGLGVTAINPLGQAIELLRRDVERLRRQADGTRLGRLVGEVIRLGVELGKLRQVERQLALDQAQQDQQAIAGLLDEADAVERLRRHYLMLDRVIAGLAQLKPLPGQMTVNVFQQWHSVVQGQGAAAPGKVQAPAQGPAKASRQAPGVHADDGTSNLAAGLALVAGGSGAAIAGVVRKLPPERRRAIRQRVAKEWQDNRVETFGKVAKAVITAEDGEERARGVGAAVGEIGGRMLGAMAPLLFKGKGKALGKASSSSMSRGSRQRRRQSKRKAELKAQKDPARKQAAGNAAEKTQEEAAQEQWAKFGGQVGEAAGGEAGGALFNWITQEEKPAPQSSEAPLLEEAQAIAQGVSSLPSLGTGKQLPLAGTLFKRVPLTAVLDTSLQVADIYQSDGTAAEKLQGYGEVFGGLGGNLAGTSAGWLGGAAAGAMLGSVVPGVGTVIGGAVGGLLGSLGGGYLGGIGGEWVGGALGKAVAAVVGSDEPAASQDIAASPEQPSRLQKGVSTPAPLPATATAQLVGSLAGSSAGGLGGAAAGAMIGSVVPGIGTVIGAAVGGLLGSLGGSYLGGMGAKLIGDASGKAGQAVAGSAMPQANQEVAGFPEQATRLPKNVGPPTPSPAVSIPPSPAMAPPAINQQFTFTANMPVTLHNSFDDPTTLQQLETIARRVLDDLMRQARAVQMVDQPQP
ncbi:hypothetical protein HU763_006060 [Pseudomonas anuradhapurensis]|uniref:hypothetical protein n=1 Tax=Pseudomonas anuradhapurensis TaxID=485870 RepID=UPI001647B9C6|nr:hypothetical protein [Pseudomonas anuradhapurensis]QXI49013.1 hypothetical protein HU763_006060 [Pseudomonas anuradhapurensis]